MILQEFVVCKAVSSSGMLVPKMKLKETEMLITKFVEAPNPLSITWFGTVSSNIFGVATTNTPLANPNINLPKHIVLKSRITDNKQPRMATKLKRITILFLPLVINCPPTTEPIAMPRIDALSRMVVFASESLPQPSCF